MSKKYYTLKADYYDTFSCTGSECLYHCCQAWNIAISEQDYLKYTTYEGELGQIAKDSIYYSEDAEVYFMRLNDHNLCPFCNKEGLCKIILDKGEKDLSYTCTIFPRYALMTSDTLERGVSLGCPHVVELFYDREDPVGFERIEMIEGTDAFEKDPISEQEAQIIEFDIQIRELLRTWLQNRSYPMWYRLFSFISVLDKISQAHQNRNDALVCQMLGSSLNENYLQAVYEQFLNQFQVDIRTQFLLQSSIFETYCKSILNIAGNQSKMIKDMILTHASMTAESYQQIQKQLNHREIKHRLEIINEHIAVEDWFHNALLARKSDYLYANGVEIILVQILLHYMRILIYQQYGKIDRELDIVSISIVERVIMHTRDRNTGLIEKLEKKELLSRGHMLLMLYDSF
ncbi:flagellin lysine-N-methylase [Roseburia sp. BX1005]|uniref:Flagellin lysine-N-methylase n=1 Tax=Roseburia zhanii TaxID=2763064 RepID=A0A923RTC3_9FIRM|nr:flagellin lysine-N-methylase [Roseburia zhanii]MBC5713710.1 flagellin lysine-N-methylase [Roseburia zhanii]